MMCSEHIDDYTVYGTVDDFVPPTLVSSTA